MRNLSSTEISDFRNHIEMNIIMRTRRQHKSTSQERRQLISVVGGFWGEEPEVHPVDEWVLAGLSQGPVYRHTEKISADVCHFVHINMLI